jgi:conjugative transfer signal peptidase TraF
MIESPQLDPFEASAQTPVEWDCWQEPRRPPKAPKDPLAPHFLLWTLYVVACGVGCVLGSCLIWNWTPSLPEGLYWKFMGSAAARGDLVAFPVPPALQPLVHERGYLPDGSVLVKPIAASAGDAVCVRDDALVINGKVFGMAMTHDHEGRMLPQDTFCGVLPAGHVYVASSVSGSFDSRTFGPVDLRDVQARVVPLWTY